MTAITFDTLKFTKRLEEAGVPRKQAEAQAEAFREAQETQLDELATKRDVMELKRDIKELELRLMHDLTLRFGGMLAVAVAVIVMIGKLL